MTPTANSNHLSNADLREANLGLSVFVQANLKGADLRGAVLQGAILNEANLIGADLRSSQLQGVNLVKANIQKADFRDCFIYGISVWDIELDNETKQSNLIIPPGITVDNLEVAQFIYLLLNNQKIRDVIDTVAKKAVLILGRFTKNRKKVLYAIADQLREMDLVPIIFDFKKSKEQDIIETVITLASLSKFIIADVTAAKVVIDELRSFVSDFSIPVVPVFQPSKNEPKPYASLYTLHKKYTWVFEPVIYKNKQHLIDILPDFIIKPAEDKRIEIRNIK